MLSLEVFTPFTLRPEGNFEESLKVPIKILAC